MVPAELAEITNLSLHIERSQSGYYLLFIMSRREWLQFHNIVGLFVQNISINLPLTPKLGSEGTPFETPSSNFTSSFHKQHGLPHLSAHHLLLRHKRSELKPEVTGHDLCRISSWLHQYTPPVPNGLHHTSEGNHLVASDLSLIVPGVAVTLSKLKTPPNT
ncbi:uncharacterized protein BDR25DRAFT_358698 [Lindgomyces ingoldianus]|uniref:Uncharacterized protein n=1 Tax=Lindgomyces ingoldianus TaxID=673940 RepID=A0ACB6QJS7_9PLEO|nr:uncharacterized protein BDR25DRAFT_358698 [Lindgomyces ingoldianus]KAF2467141.1 hypothetical protein BDR25DRAFT_358698 [Lindgomyces ingoldianus]